MFDLADIVMAIGSMLIFIGMGGLIWLVVELIEKLID